MLTVIRRVEWWGVVENGVLTFASSRKEEAAQVGDPVPITVQYPIEEVTTPERMVEVFEGIKVSDAKYREVMEEVAADDLRFEQEMSTWMAENKHWNMVRATFGDRMFDEFADEVKQWVYDRT